MVVALDSTVVLVAVVLVDIECYRGKRHCSRRCMPGGRRWCPRRCSRWILGCLALGCCVVGSVPFYSFHVVGVCLFSVLICFRSFLVFFVVLIFFELRGNSVGI